MPLLCARMQLSILRALPRDAKGRGSSCLICVEPAVAIDANEDYLERSCMKCGHYRVTGAAFMLIRARGWRFDVELPRKWIGDKQSTGSIPIIVSHQAGRLIDLSSACYAISAQLPK